MEELKVWRIQDFGVGDVIKFDQGWDPGKIGGEQEYLIVEESELAIGGRISERGWIRVHLRPVSTETRSVVGIGRLTRYTTDPPISGDSMHFEYKREPYSAEQKVTRIRRMDVNMRIEFTL
ncbi:MAG: hypothetical protein WA001_03840 [Patescibacteria group bacterium]